MEKPFVKDILYAGLEEVLSNKNYYYFSSVGSGYSHLTEHGKAAVLEYIEFYAYEIIKADHADMEQRARDLVMNELKREHK